MNQRRFFLSGPRSAAEAAFPFVAEAFEDDGYSVALTEIDEDADLHEISVYADADIAVRLSEATVRWRSDLSVVASEDVPEVDWVAASLKTLSPVRAGRFLVHGRHDRDRRRAGDIAIEIEAGLAFGTGHHGTTAGCLELISTVLARRTVRNALDLGAGSAVLAIAVAKLARIPVLATDIDPVATRVAAENARLNGMSAFVATATATGFAGRAIAREAPFDLIVANILARPLMKLAPVMARHLAPGGSAILSGILDRQRNAVIAAYRGQGFRHVRTLHRNGWSTILLER